MSFALALAIAASWWGGHGVTIPCHPTPVYATEQQMASYGAAGATMGSWPASYRCVIVISTLDGTPKTTLDDSREFCSDVTHEFGNLAGIPETSHAGLVTDQADPPMIWACRHWRGWRQEHWGY